MRICPGDSGPPVTAPGRSVLHGTPSVRPAAGVRRTQRAWVAAAGLLALSAGCSRRMPVREAAPPDSLAGASSDSDSLTPRDTAGRGTPIGDPAALPRPAVRIPRSTTDSGPRHQQ